MEDELKQTIAAEFRSVECALDPWDRELAALPLSRPTTLARSKSAATFCRPNGRIDWLRKSLPPSRREQRSLKPPDPKSKENKHAREVPIPRTKSANFKRARANTYLARRRSLQLSGRGRVRRSPSLTSGSDATDAELGFVGVRRIFSRASVRSVLPVVQKIKETRARKWTVAIFSLVAALLASVRGFTLAFNSNATLDLTGEAQDLPQSYLFSTFLISIFAALAQVGSVFGGPIGGLVADSCGRKCAMLFSGVPYIIGYMTLSYGHYAPTATAFKALLLTGRFVSGIGMGWASAVVSVYIAEISPVKLRGVFGSLNEIMLTCGIIFNYGVGSIEHFPYFKVAMVAVGLVALFEVLMIWLPETPRSLLSRGYLEEAQSSLRLLRGSEYDIDREIEEMKESIIAARRKNGTSVWRQFLKKNVSIPVIYVLIVLFFTQGGGISIIASYAATIFSDAGIGNPRVTAIYAVGVASLIGNIASFFTVDLLGRKILLLLSGTGMVIGSVMLGTHFLITRPSLCHSLNSTITEVTDAFEETPCNTVYAPLAIISLILFRFSYSVGWGPIPWLLLSELLPLSVRGVASGIATFLTSSTAAVVSGSFLPYSQLVSPWFAVWTFTMINIVAAVFVLVFIPETKGKSLEELEKQFQKNVNPLHCCSFEDKVDGRSTNEDTIT